MTKRELAERVGVSSRTIAAYESDKEFGPSEETLVALAKALSFSIEFLVGEEVESIPLDTVSFRALSRLTARVRDSALGAADIALLINEWLESRFKLPDADLLDLRDEDPEAAAEALRVEWEQGYRPVKNVIHLLESKGIRVYSLSEDTDAVDAFSFWRGTTPFIFLNTRKSAERSRFDAAHELGHLVLHKHGTPQGREAERQADRFAAAFLMPASSVYSKVKRTPTLQNILAYKKFWKVSAAAFEYRLWQLKLISEWHHRSLCIEMAPYRKREPDPIPREQSLLFPKVFASLAEDGMNQTDLARAVGISRPQLSELVFGLNVIDGHANGSSRRRPRLRLV